LNSNVARFQYLGSHRAAVRQLIMSGELESQVIDGLEYVWPTPMKIMEAGEPMVRFLAPFDPLVWDRRRFEHLWGWAYRFEAYTPPTKRVRGYYAMPLLWEDDVIGWANANVRAGRLSIDVGFTKPPPSGPDFGHALEAETERLRSFLGAT
jgi:uncharacterized protein YcaQ